MREKLKIRSIFYILLAGTFLLLFCFYPGQDLISARRDGFPAENTEYIDPSPVALSEDLTSNSELKASAKTAFDIVNAKRQEAGLSALSWNSGLEQASAVRAVEASESFSHTRPNGSDWWTVNSNLMYGENLAKGYATAGSAVDAWLASPTHKANIMDAEFTSGAIAIHIGSNGQWFWAQEFGY